MAAPSRHSTPQSFRNAYLALAIGLLGLGLSAILVRVAEAPGTVSVFYRMATAIVFVSILFSRRLKLSLKRLSRRVMAVAIFGGILFGLDVALWSTGIVLSGATNPTFMANLAPLWVGLGSVWLFHERQTLVFWLGLVLALAGAGLMLGEDLSRAADIGLGTFLGLLAAIFYGGYMLVTQRGRIQANTLVYFWITTLTASILLLIINLLLDLPITGYPPRTYLVFLALGLVVQVLGWMVVNYAQGYLPASIVSPTLLAQPVITALIASIFLGESFTLWHIFGGGAILLGVYLVHRSRWDYPPPR